MMKASEARSPATSGGGPWPERLESLLDELVEAHEALSEAARAHRAALSAAEPTEMATALEGVQATLQRIAELERRRGALVAEAIQSDRALRARDRAGDPAPRLSELARTLKGERRERLLGRAERLREAITSARRDVSALRAASGALLGHVQGLIQQIAGTIGGAATYAPGGRPGAAQAAGCGIDLTQ